MTEGTAGVYVADPRARHNVTLALVPLGIGLLSLVSLFWPECQAAVSVWYHSTAYGHCFLVIPIAAYLVWERRESLRGLIPQPSPRFAALGLPLPFIWLAAERLGIMEGRQIVFILMVELLLLTALGWQLFRVMMGPFLYLVFLVPFGAFVTPLLQTFTAVFIDVGLTVLGIPHFVNDMVIEISAGTFYVAEACAGLRFLIASIAFGVFFALLNYNSPARRAVFIVASILIPIVANGFRAFGIVVLGHMLGSAEAAAADHILYGWMFFSIVMLLLVAAGLPFRELPNKGVLFIDKPVTAFRYPWAALLVVLVGATGPATARALDSRAEPARFKRSPVFEALPGCTFATANSSNVPIDRFTTIMTCPDRVWTIKIQLIPSRSTAAELNEVRRRLMGPVDDDETVTGPLQNAPGWQTVVTREPPQITGISSWIDGRVSEGGLRQRFLQARQSVFGGDHEALVVAITAKPAHGFTTAESRAVVSELSRFVAVQRDFAEMIGDLTMR